jgi:Iron only hydrogenase large subunit, C-terminal domain
MPKFDTNVQELKYKVLKEIAKASFSDTLKDDFYDIPDIVVPGPKPTMRCCIYKERAIVLKRMKLATSGTKNNKNVVQVLNIACDECPLGGYKVTENCRGCIAHRCEKACFKKAITFDIKTHQAIIDKTKCVNCGMCAKACQYGAILNFKRPCESACKVKAISMGEDYAAKIDDSKCIQCGACVYQCPWGAIMDASSITEVIGFLKDSDFSKKYNVYAVVAPSISSQFKYVTLGQVITALKNLGFHSIVEAALGADMTAYDEAKELSEKKFLLSSCCPSFVTYIKKYYPNLVKYISSNLSPMARISKYIKESDPTAKIVFIGPCISKKEEINLDTVKPYVDSVLTFEELQALIDARDIDMAQLKESKLNNASYFGRIFARCGGLSDAVVEALKEQNINFEVKGVHADGLENCKLMLDKLNSGNADFNFLEGMACTNGCIGGPCCLTHEMRDKSEVDKYGKEALEKTITSAIDVLK